MSRANTPLEGGFESPHKNLTNSLVGTDIQAQLSTSTDVSAAHDFFRAPASAQSYLPQFSGFEVPATPVQGTGAETLAVKAMGAEGAFAKAMVPTGAEASLFKTPGLEASTFAGMQPGADPMNPLIQLILKMPGALGMMQDLFEFLGALFLNPLETLAHNLLDPSSWLSHATDALGELGSDHVVNMGLVPGDAPIFGMENGHHGSLFENLGKEANSLQFGPSYNDLTVNGLPEGKPLFEQPSQDLDFNFRGPQLAFDNGANQFQPSFGTSASQPVTLPSQTTPQDLYNQTMDQSMQRGDLLNPTATPSYEGAPAGHEATPATTAQNTEAATTGEAPVEATTQPYTVKSGDNLWDIAKDRLGDGQRWGEIYKMNTNVLGENPRLIMPGTEIQLPGADGSIASAGAENYLVKSGDNLWNISKDHLGGGEHWPDIYHQNSDVVGSNPDLIHPGQELKIDHSQVAHHDAGAHHTAHHGGGHHGGGHHGGEHHSGAHHGAQHQVAHNNHGNNHTNHAHTSNHSNQTAASHGQQSAQAAPPADKAVAAGKPDTQATAPAQAQTDYATGSSTPTGAVGLKTTQTMGSLESQT